jgi:hypothetical protein
MTTDVGNIRSCMCSGIGSNGRNKDIDSCSLTPSGVTLLRALPRRRVDVVAARKVQNSVILECQSVFSQVDLEWYVHLNIDVAVDEDGK